LATGGTVSATGTGTFGNVATGGTVSATGNVTGGNVLTGGVVSATSTITGGNLATGGTISSTGTATVGNVATAGTVSATGNVTGGNLITSGAIEGSSVSVTGTVTGATAVNSGGTMSATGTITGGNVATAGTVSATGTITSSNTITGGNLATGGTISSTGTATVGNVATSGTMSATGNITGGNISTAGSGTFGNIVVQADDITGLNGVVTINGALGDVNFAVNGDTTANIFFVDAGTESVSIGSATQTTGAVLALNATTSFLAPVGNTSQRPTGVTGMLRFNSEINSMEVFDTNSEWTPVGQQEITVITDDQFSGDGSTVAFTLSQESTTAGTIVAINGVQQIPVTAYAVSGTTITFTEAPAIGDVIDCRILTTTTTVSAIQNSGATAKVSTPTGGNVDITGNILPVANVTYNLGSDTLRWNQLYLAGNTISLGSIKIKDTGGQIGFFENDGTTPATIDSASVDTTTIANGTSSLAVIASNGNIRANVNGTTVATIYGTGVEIAGDLTVTGNATLSGNILGDRIQNGTTTIDIQSAGGNANVTIGGTNNVGVFHTGGLNVTGAISASGTVTGTSFIGVATSAQYADLAENYAGDASYEPGTVVEFGGSAEVTVCDHDMCSRVAGVVSTHPAYTMNSELAAAHVVTVAFTGRVPCKVVGTVRKGDLMVAAGNGAARAEANPKPGTIIGKALADHEGAGVIEVVVGRF